MKKTLRIVVIAFLMIALVVGIIYGVLPTLKEELEVYQEEQEYAQIASEYVESSYDQIVDIEVPDEVQDDASNQSPGHKSSGNRKRLKEKNSDYIGWLSSPDTPINYPVVHSDDSQYYLHRNFKKQRSSLGTLFACGKVDFETPNQNITIYGHNMGRGRGVMFGTLLKYKKQGYFKDHGVFRFDTIYNTGEYQVFAACNVRLSENFNYSQQEFVSDKEFQRFVHTVKERTNYDTHVDVPPGAQIITLSTCDRSYGGTDGRFVVMAVKVAD